MNQHGNKVSEHVFYNMLDKNIPGGSADELIGIGSSRIVCLEKVSMDGLDEMYEYSKDRRLYKYFEFEPHKTIGDTEKYLNKLLDRIGTEVVGRTAMYWFVRRLKDAKMVGSIGLLNIDYQRRSTEWGFAVSPEYWGKGYILEVLDLVKRYVFEELKLNRLFGTTMVENKTAISSTVAAGFKQEGVLRQYYRSSDGFHDAVILSMIADDYFLSEQAAVGKTASKPLSREEIAGIVAVILGEADVGVNDSMETTMNWDSLNHINVIVGIEEKSGYKFSPEEISRARSIEAVYKIISP